MSSPPEKRQAGLPQAIDSAIGGDTRALFDLLTRGSGLPGPRMNLALAEAFADDCRARKGGADRLAEALASLDADSAPGASPREFLPVCGVLAVTARASAGERERARALEVLHERADDLRFRVRDAVVLGLVRIGGGDGDRLLRDVSSWMDGYFHAAAVLTAVAHNDWLNQISDEKTIVLRLNEAFELAKGANRSTARYPGWKALFDALVLAPPAAAVRFGVPIFDMLCEWAAVNDPVLREAVLTMLGSKRLIAGRLASEVTRVRNAVAAATPAPRDPRSNLRPTRGRGGYRRR